MTSEHPEGTRLEVLVQPRASRSAVVGEHDGRLKIALTAPPVDGKANKALRKLLASRLRVPGSHIELEAGQTGRRKRVLIRGLSPAEVRERLVR